MPMIQAYLSMLCFEMWAVCQQVCSKSVKTAKPMKQDLTSLTVAQDSLPPSSSIQVPKTPTIISVSAHSFSGGPLHYRG